MPTLQRKPRVTSVSTESLRTAFSVRIEQGSTFYSDGAPQYVNFAMDLGLGLLQLEQKEGRRGLYNIQHINSYHLNVSCRYACTSPCSTRSCCR